jgi:hypothetical protein
VVAHQQPHKTKLKSKQLSAEVIMAGNDEDEYDGIEDDEQEELGVEEETHDEIDNESFPRRCLCNSDISLIVFVLKSAKSDLQIIGDHGNTDDYAGKTTCTRKSNKKIDFTLMLSNMGFQDAQSKEARSLVVAIWEQSIQLSKNLAFYDPALCDDVDLVDNDANNQNGFLESFVHNWALHENNTGNIEFASIFKNQIIKKVSGQIFIARSLLTL